MWGHLEQQPAWVVWLGGGLACVILSVMAYGWVVQPSHARKQEALQLSAEAKQRHAEVQRLEDQLDALGQTLRQQEDQLAALPLSLGDPRQLNRKIAQVIALAQEHELEVLQLQPGEPTRAEHFDLVPLRLQATAGFPQHLAFLEALHTRFPSVSVLGLELAGPSRAEAARPEAAYRLMWFTAKPDAAAADPAGAAAGVDPSADR
jgi:Tfp pilus assembly protein PilO